MLKIERVHVTFNAGTASEVKALRGISLDVQEGEFVTVIGANGAGKSTLFNIIAGTNLPDRGSIWLNEHNISQWSEPRRSKFIGRVFQNPALGTCPGLTIAENLALAMRRGKRHGLRPAIKREERSLFFERLRGVGMGLEQRLDTDVALLSGGQRQAVTLLMATLTHPKLLLLDEHTAALDPNAAAQIIDLTVRLAEENRLTVIMITHSMQHATTVGSRVVMMNRGEFIYDISGAERAHLTVDQLIHRFRSLRKDVELSDKTLLE
jgi:putative ABC transport system ATP-binding protein